MQEVQGEQQKTSVRLEALQTSCDSSKQDINNLSETVAQLEAEKAEKVAKLICIQAENETLKAEIQDVKVTRFFVAIELYIIIKVCFSVDHSIHYNLQIVSCRNPVHLIPVRQIYE